MKKIITIILLLVVAFLSAQNNNRESWSFGLGLSNHTMAGDHRSIGTGLSDGANDNKIFNLGGYLYVDKMFNPAFGLELKGFYTTMAGSAQEITNGYVIRDVSAILHDTHFDGTAYGAELGVIINFSNLAPRPYRTKVRKWNLAGYFGMGLQNYDSKLYDNATGNMLIDFGNNPSDDGIANSVYYTTGLGLKYKLSKNFDIELRPTVNFNEEDHLDAARTDKQKMEVFFQTNLGLVFKINDKEHDNYVWHGRTEEPVIEEKPNIQELVNAAVVAKLASYPKFNAEKDTDKDGFVDTEDNCPLRYSKTNNGCPGDKDKDGIDDDKDLCPEEAGSKYNNGCPQSNNAVQTIVSNNSDYITEHVYFDLDSANLNKESMDILNNIVLYSLRHPNQQFDIHGHTDKGGTEIYNQNLSERRANTVKAYLIKSGVIASSLHIVAYGENQPKFENKTINRHNRRVDIMPRK